MKDRRRRGFKSWPTKKSRQQHKVSGCGNREYLEHVKCCHDTDHNEPMMKKGFTASKSGTWEEYKEIFRKKMTASECAFDRIKEAFELVAQDETEKMSIVQEITLRSTDNL